MSDATKQLRDAGLWRDPRELPGHWLYVTNDDGVLIAIENARLEADGDESGTWFAPEYDSLRIRDGEAWRELTEDEEVEHHDEIRQWLRSQEWER